MLVSTPYRANSIVNISKTLVKSGYLERFYTPLHLAKWELAAKRIPLIGSRLSIEMGRRGFRGIPAERVKTVATVTELLHVCVRRLCNQRCPDLTSQWMYKTKAVFDAAVSCTLKEPTDIFIGMYASSLESFKAVKACGGLNVLNFVNSHPLDQNFYLSSLAGLDATHHEMIPDWITQRVERELDLADLILVPSGFVAQQLLGHRIASEKIAIIPYGVDLRSFHPGPMTQRETKQVECLYVGQISHRKGISTLLEAAKLLRHLPVNFRLIGPIVSREVLADMPDNVVYEGLSHPSGVANVMRNADLFVSPTLEDAFALVVLEAMASGLPVVTTMNAGSAELVHNGHNALIVPPGDAEALAESIRHLVESAELRRSLGVAAQQTVQGEHSWEDYGRRVLEKIIARRKELGLSYGSHGSSACEA